MTLLLAHLHHLAWLIHHIHAHLQAACGSVLNPNMPDFPECPR